MCVCFGLKGRKCFVGRIWLRAAVNEKCCFHRKTLNGSKGQQSVRGRVVRSPRCQWDVDPLLQRTDICVSPPPSPWGTDARAPRYEESCRCHSPVQITPTVLKMNKCTHAVRACLLQTHTIRCHTTDCMFLFIHRAFSTSVQVIFHSKPNRNQNKPWKASLSRQALNWWDAPGSLRQFRG